MTRSGKPLTYDAVGVVAAGRDEDTLGDLGRWVTKTFGLNPAKPLLPLGYYANILPLTAELGLAISTDGVGTKILVAQEMGRYDTVGIDCVAMNANDVICVGARPISMVDTSPCRRPTRPSSASWPRGSTPAPSKLASTSRLGRSRRCAS